MRLIVKNFFNHFPDRRVKYCFFLPKKNGNFLIPLRDQRSSAGGNFKGSGRVPLRETLGERPPGEHAAGDGLYIRITEKRSPTIIQMRQPMPADERLPADSRQKKRHTAGKQAIENQLPRRLMQSDEHDPLFPFKRNDRPMKLSLKPLGRHDDLRFTGVHQPPVIVRFAGFGRDQIIIIMCTPVEQSGSIGAKCHIRRVMNQQLCPIPQQPGEFRRKKYCLVHPDQFLCLCRNPSTNIFIQTGNHRTDLKSPADASPQTRRVLQRNRRINHGELSRWEIPQQALTPHSAGASGTEWCDISDFHSCLFPETTRILSMTIRPLSSSTGIT